MGCWRRGENHRWEERINRKSNQTLKNATELLEDMDEKTHSGKGVSAKIWAGIALILVGVILGVSLAPYVEPFTNPERAQSIDQQEALATQNQLLKGQVDCLVNGIQLNKGKATLTECT
jgi:hypothetical protein